MLFPCRTSHVISWLKSQNFYPEYKRILMSPVQQSTSLFQCDGQWWAYCCLSCWFTSLTACCLNRRLEGALCTGICFGTLALLLFTSVALGAATFLLTWEDINDESDKITWILICFSAVCVFLLASITLKFMLCRQRCHFLTNQRQHLAHPNKEGCCETCCIVLFCFPCSHGQIASATLTT